MSWVASGMSMLPGLSPRPQHHLVNKKDFTEKVESTSNATFVSVRECEKGNIEVTGKVGKISLERSNGLKLSLDNPVVGGVLEVIKCQDVYIRLHQEGEVPTFQVDDSSNVTIEICTRSQIECLYYIRCQGLKLILNDAELSDDSSFQYEIPTEEARANLQQIAHWSAASADASFVAEGVVRDGVYPTTAEMKLASDAKKQQMINGMASMLLGGIDIRKPEPLQDGKSNQGSTEDENEKDKQLNLPD